MHFKEIIKNKRKELCLSQSALAKKLGVSWITIWRWENGHTEPGDNAKIGIMSKLKKSD